MSELNRRALFATAGLTAAAVGLEAKAGVATPAPAALPISLAATAAPVARAARARPSSAQDVEWLGAKRDLSAEGKYSWLAKFTNERFADQIINARLLPLEPLEPPYDIYQLESSISSASNLLDRCLEYRRELYELEELAVRHALEYQLFDEQFDAQLNIEMSNRTESQRRAEEVGHREAERRFGAGNDPLARGFEQIAKASKTATVETILSETERKANVQAKWQALRRYQTALLDRHRTPGHVLNFAERADRVQAYIEQDVATAYAKCRCVAVGMKRILGVEIDFPRVGGAAYLDKLVMFLRDVIKSYEIATLEEVEFEQTISFHQPRTGANGAALSSVVNDSNWTTKLSPQGDGLFTLDLASEFPASMKRLRVRAMTMTYLIDSPGDLANRLRSMSAVVFPPLVENEFSSGSKRIRPPVPITRIPFYDPAQIQYLPNTAVENLDPRGTWTVQLSTNMIYPDGAAHGRLAQAIKDVKLHFRLAGVFDKDAAAWRGFSN